MFLPAAMVPSGVAEKAGALVGEAATVHCGEADPAAAALPGSVAIPAAAIVPAIISRRLQWVRGIVQSPQSCRGVFLDEKHDIEEEHGRMNPRDANARPRRSSFWTEQGGYGVLTSRRSSQNPAGDPFSPCGRRACPGLDPGWRGAPYEGSLDFGGLGAAAGGDGEVSRPLIPLRAPSPTRGKEVSAHPTGPLERGEDPDQCASTDRVTPTGSGFAFGAPE